MSDPIQPTDECVSLAGRVLAAGNPLDNPQVMKALVAGLAQHASRLEPDGVREAVRVALGVYFENALSLAGHILGEESAEAAADQAEKNRYEFIVGEEPPRYGWPVVQGQELRLGDLIGIDQETGQARLAKVGDRILCTFDQNMSINEDGMLEIPKHVFQMQAGTSVIFDERGVDLDSLAMDDAVLGLLKGMHPKGTTWAHLSMAIDRRGSEIKPIAKLLLESGAVRQEDATVYASLDAVADKSIPALPWPPRDF